MLISQVLMVSCFEYSDGLTVTSSSNSFFMALNSAMSDSHLSTRSVAALLTSDVGG
jgi:hypothetical protein